MERILTILLDLRVIIAPFVNDYKLKLEHSQSPTTWFKYDTYFISDFILIIHYIF